MEMVVRGEKDLGTGSNDGDPCMSRKYVASHDIRQRPRERHTVEVPAGCTIKFLSFLQSFSLCIGSLP
jgi:hypothetical protein